MITRNLRPGMAFLAREQHKDSICIYVIIGVVPTPGIGCCLDINSVAMWGDGVTQFAVWSSRDDGKDCFDETYWTLITP